MLVWTIAVTGKKSFRIRKFPGFLWTGPETNLRLRNFMLSYFFQHFCVEVYIKQIGRGPSAHHPRERDRNSGNLEAIMNMRNVVGVQRQRNFCFKPSSTWFAQFLFEIVFL